MSEKNENVEQEVTEEIKKLMKKKVNYKKTTRIRRFDRQI